MRGTWVRTRIGYEKPNIKGYTDNFFPLPCKRYTIIGRVFRAGSEALGREVLGDPSSEAHITLLPLPVACILLV